MNQSSKTEVGAAVGTEQTIYAELRQMIESGVLSLGMKLPTERELALRYGVGRKLVRQALDRLTDAALIERKVGSGTFVRGPDDLPHPRWMTAPPPVSPLEAIEARRVLEVGVIELVIARARDEDFDRMEAALLEQEQTDDPSEFRSAAFKFNTALIRAAHNSLLHAMYEMLITARVQAGWNRLGFLVNDPAGRAASCARSREFLDLLRARRGKDAHDQRYLDLSALIARILTRALD